GHVAGPGILPLRPLRRVPRPAPARLSAAGGALSAHCAGRWSAAQRGAPAASRRRGRTAEALRPCNGPPTADTAGGTAGARAGGGGETARRDGAPAGRGRPPA